MSLINLRNISLGFIGPPLLDGINLTIEPGERVCLVGRNGEGKSSLMRLIHGDLEPDDGEIIRGAGVTTAVLAQQVPGSLTGTIFDQVAGGLAKQGELLADYHRVSHRLATESDAALQKEFDRLGHELEIHGGWEVNQRVEAVMSRMGLDPDAQVAGLSAGMKRRVLLARALVSEPELLLLDEPTNHLDVEAICWLEEFLARHDGALLFVTHDRMLVRRVATRILDLDRGALTSWDCGYDAYVDRKEAALENEARERALFDKKLAQEEAWIRKGVLARRTRNEGRVRALKSLRVTRRERRERPEAARMQLQDAERSGRLVIQAKAASFAYETGPTVLANVSTHVMRGDRIGIIGPNGSGKTTLMRMLLGELTPTSGSIRHGTKLEIAYFDQLHAQLDEEMSVAENVADGSDSVMIQGRKKHILGYLQDFLFSPDRARSPVKQLSGGERNRLLLARLFTKPANVLALDEPTNDLDAETLELLEELLLEYSGAILLVSHDREFLNNVVTSTLVLEDEAQVKEYAGGYDDWITQRSAAPDAAPEPEKVTLKQERSRRQPAKDSPAGRLTYNEKRELEALPAQVEELEGQVEEIHEVMAEASFYQKPREEIIVTTGREEALQKSLEEAYARWEALEAKSS